MAGDVSFFTARKKDAKSSGNALGRDKRGSRRGGAITDKMKKKSLKSNS